MYQVMTKSGSQTSAGNQLPAGIEVGLGVKPNSTQKIFTQGDYKQTGNQFDFAIEGNGFFQVDNNGVTVYTRSGGFKLNRDGIVTNAEGLPVAPEISAPQGTVAFTVDSGGTWTASDSAGAALATGRMELADFLNPAGLTSIGRNLYEKTDGSGEPFTGNPGENGFGTVTQRFLEMANVSVIDEMVSMIVGQRAYEINSKAVQTADSMLGIINSLKRS
jgi:flagellar basal-body rod protein FlgG